MAISERTRKILWVKAGGRCSICRKQVVTEAEANGDAPSVYGQECHIVAKSPGGPRAGKIEDQDGYRNLILLCAPHHKQVDDQPAHFSVERLHQLKRDHEALEALRSGPVRLIADPAKPSPKVFVACFKGDTLWSHVQGSHSMQSLVAANLNDEQGDAVAELQDYLGDLLNVASEMSNTEGRELARELSGRIGHLLELGIVIGVRQHYQLLTGGIDAEPSSWRSFDIMFDLVSEAELADAAGKPYADRAPV
jgi:hypothetical protein